MRLLHNDLVKIGQVVGLVGSHYYNIYYNHCLSVHLVMASDLQIMSSQAPGRYIIRTNHRALLLSFHPSVDLYRSPLGVGRKRDNISHVKNGQEHLHMSTEAISNKCIASNNKGLTSSNKKLLEMSFLHSSNTAPTQRLMTQRHTPPPGSKPPAAQLHG